MKNGTTSLRGVMIPIPISTFTNFSTRIENRQSHRDAYFLSQWSRIPRYFYDIVRKLEMDDLVHKFNAY
jgi:hypothetical protein